MSITIALAGNPNSGKTTMFNALTGSNQYVGNWPGVTVEKKEGRLRGHRDVTIQDLPGIYSLSPYTLEEVVARSYLVGERPDVILNIVDGTNIERNLYLTTQLIELGIPVVVAVNMMDVVRKNGDRIDLEKLGKELGCAVIATSALKGEGGMAAAEKAVELANTKRQGEHPHVFTGSVEHAIAHIEESVSAKVEPGVLRWYAIKLFERDEKAAGELGLDKSLLDHIELHIQDCEKELDDDAESIITNQRYAYISKVTDKCLKKARAAHSLSASDKIDRVVTNRILALPIFALVMFAVYYISIGTVGDFLTNWTNDTLFSELICGNLRAWMEGMEVAPWLVGLTVDGIVGKATWYRIKEIYTSVKKLSDLTGEGISPEEVTPLYPNRLTIGDTGISAATVQYYLNVISYFNDQIPEVPIDGIYSADTAASVAAFQQQYGLEPTGITDGPTWYKMQEIYRGILSIVDSQHANQKPAIYPGYILVQGMRGNDVENLQRYLTTISSQQPAIPLTEVTGYFGPRTKAAVESFQEIYGIPVNGRVGALTWNTITYVYRILTGESG